MYSKAPIQLYVLCEAIMDEDFVCVFVHGVCTNLMAAKASKKLPEQCCLVVFEFSGDVVQERTSANDDQACFRARERDVGALHIENELGDLRYSHRVRCRR